jgi:hypothetical protein
MLQSPIRRCNTTFLHTRRLEAHMQSSFLRPHTPVKSDISQHGNAAQMQNHDEASLISWSSFGSKRSLPNSLASLARVALVCALLALVSPDALFPVVPVLGAKVVSLARLCLLLLINLDKPLVVELLVLALVAPLGDPFAARLVVNQLAVALLVLDTLLGGKALPLGLLLGLGDGLLAGQRCGGRREDEVDALGGRLDLAGREELVDEGLGGIAGGGGKRLFVDSLDGVGVVGEQVAQVKGEGRGLVDGNGPGDCQQAAGRVLGTRTDRRPVAVESASD